MIDLHINRVSISWGTISYTLMEQACSERSRKMHSTPSLLTLGLAFSLWFYMNVQFDFDSVSGPGATLCFIQRWGIRQRARAHVTSAYVNSAFEDFPRVWWQLFCFRGKFNKVLSVPLYRLRWENSRDRGLFCCDYHSFWHGTSQNDS